MAAAAINKGLGRAKPPGRAPNGLWHDTRPKRPKDGVAAPGQKLDINFLGRFLSTPDEFGPETGSIGSILKLSFHPYQVRPNPTPYATWASVLVRPVPGVRN